MVGQRSVVQTLQNAIRTNRVTQAYLFSGMRGTGKTTAARILAKALNCVKGPTPHALQRLRVLRGDRRGPLPRRPRDRRRLEPAASTTSEPSARASNTSPSTAGPRSSSSTRSTRSPSHALQRPPQDARGAAAEHGLHLRDDGVQQGPGDDRLALPALRVQEDLPQGDHQPPDGYREEGEHHHHPRRPRPHRRRLGGEPPRRPEPSRPGRRLQRRGHQRRGAQGDPRARSPGPPFRGARRPSSTRSRTPSSPSSTGSSRAASTSASSSRSSSSTSATCSWSARSRSPGTSCP